MDTIEIKKIAYTLELNATVAETAQRLTKELNSRGFGVLSNIDVQKIIKEKLGEHIDSYVILDVCNPTHAKKAIDTHKEVGLVLPCKVTIFENQGKVLISLYKPTEAVKLLGFTDLDPLASQVESELKGAIDALAV